MRRSHSKMIADSYPNYPYGCYPHLGPYPYLGYAGIPFAAEPLSDTSPQQYNRKRQRRQAAAVTVQSFWNNSNGQPGHPNNNNNNMGRKSTAQPRPALHVPPRGIGPIEEPNNNDVLCGRGGRINSHAGNVQFREVINARKKEYLAPTTKKLEKAHIAAAIVNDIRSMDPPGRFLKEERDTGLWYDIGDAKAIKKTGQALREDAPDIRDELENSSGDEDKKATPKSKDGDGDKKEKPKSPKATTNKATIKASPRTTGMVSGRGAKHNPTAVPSTSMNPEDYQAQMAMPPPYSFQPNPFATQATVGTQQGFESRTIPIQAPQHTTMYSLPNQLMTGARNVGQRVVGASRQALEVLSQSGGQGAEETGTPDDTLFGKPFHPPSSAILNSDNTMSDISGLSNPLSSNMGPSSGFGSGLMDYRGAPMELAGSSPSRNAAIRRQQLQNQSLRLSQLASLTSSSRSRLSDLTNSGRTGTSLTRSLSLTDMNSIADHESWKAIMEGDEQMNESQEEMQSMMSGFTGKNSLGTISRTGNSRMAASAMSVASMSTGLSAASSGRWLVGLRGGEVLDDGHSIGGLSEMSAEVLALDLAAPFQPL